MKKKIIFLLIVFIGIFIRFWSIESIVPFGCDQARDAFKVTSLLQGHLLVDGPRTGIGNFYLGPLYFYLLAPFFLLTNFDPIASQYLNIVLNIITFSVVFYVTKRLFSTPFAFLVLGMYIVSSYLIEANRIAWNVTLIPSLSFLIFYFTYKTFTEKKYLWSTLLMTFSGLFFHAHFTAIIFPIAIFILWLTSSEKIKLFKLFITALPFYFLWFIPTIISFFISDQSHVVVNNFFRDYFVGIHLQFILHRLPEIFIQFRTILSLPSPFEYLLLCALGVSFFFSSRKLHIKIIFSWIVAILLIFGIYGGPISDYYFLLTLPLVFYSFVILFEVGLRFSKPTTIIVLLLFLVYFLFINIYNTGKKHSANSLAQQKQFVQKQIKKGQTFQYNECDFHSYLYLLYTDKLK